MSEELKVAGRDEEQVRQGLNLLGITQAQYNAISDRWEEFDMMGLPAPFAYGDSGYFRAWSVDCLNDSRCREILEDDIGIENLPDFSAYDNTGLPRYHDLNPRLTIWQSVKRFLAMCWYNYSQSGIERQQFFDNKDSE